MRHNARHNTRPAKLSRQMREILGWVHDHRGEGGWASFTVAEFLGIRHESIPRRQLNSVLRSLDRLERRNPALVTRRRKSGSGYDGRPLTLRLSRLGEQVVKRQREPATPIEAVQVPVYRRAQEADMAHGELFRVLLMVYRGPEPGSTGAEWSSRLAELRAKAEEIRKRLDAIGDESPESLMSSQANFVSALSQLLEDWPGLDFLHLAEEAKRSRAYEVRLLEQAIELGIDPRRLEIQNLDLRFLQQPLSPKE